MAANSFLGESMVAPGAEMAYWSPLSKEIAEATTVEQVLRHVSENCGSYTAADVASAANQMGRLYVAETVGGQHQAGRHLTSGLDQLAELCRKYAKECSGTDIGDVLWAFSKVDSESAVRDAVFIEVSDEVVRRLRLEVEDQFSSAWLGARTLANAVFSFALCGRNPGDRALAALAQSVVQQLRDFRPQGLSNIVWAYGKLGAAVTGAVRNLLDSVAAEAASQLMDPRSWRHFLPSNVANLMFGYAALEFHPGRVLVDAVCRNVQAQLSLFSAGDLSQLMWAFTRLQQLQHSEALPEVIDQMFERFVGHLESRGNGEGLRHEVVVRMLCAYASVETTGGRVARVSSTLKEWARQSSAQLEAMRPEELSRAVWALAVLQCPPALEVMKKYVQGLQDRLSSLGHEEMICSLWALAALRLHPGRALLSQLLQQLQLRQGQLRQSMIARALWAVSQLGPVVGGGFVPQLAAQYAAQGLCTKPAELCQVLAGVLLHLDELSEKTTQVLVESVAAVSAEEYSSAELWELFQLVMAAGPGAPVFRALPEAVMARARKAWLEKRPGPEHGQFHTEVTHLLYEELELAAKENKLTEDELIRVGIALAPYAAASEPNAEASTQPIALELCDAGTCFVNPPGVPTGAVLRRVLSLAARRWRIVLLPYDVWHGFGSRQDKAAALRRLLSASETVVWMVGDDGNAQATHVGGASARELREVLARFMPLPSCSSDAAASAQLSGANGDRAAAASDSQALQLWAAPPDWEVHGMMEEQEAPAAAEAAVAVAAPAAGAAAAGGASPAAVKVPPLGSTFPPEATLPPDALPLDDVARQKLQSLARHAESLVVVPALLPEQPLPAKPPHLQEELALEAWRRNTQGPLPALLQKQQQQQQQLAGGAEGALPVLSALQLQQQLQQQQMGGGSVASAAVQGPNALSQSAAGIPPTQLLADAHGAVGTAVGAAGLSFHLPHSAGTSASGTGSAHSSGGSGAAAEERFRTDAAPAVVPLAREPRPPEHWGVRPMPTPSMQALHPLQQPQRPHAMLPQGPAPGHGAAFPPWQAQAAARMAGPPPEYADAAMSAYQTAPPALLGAAGDVPLRAPPDALLARSRAVSGAGAGSGSGGVPSDSSMSMHMLQQQLADWHGGQAALHMPYEDGMAAGMPASGVSIRPGSAAAAPRPGASRSGSGSWFSMDPAATAAAPVAWYSKGSRVSSAGRPPGGSGSGGSGSGSGSVPGKSALEKPPEDLRRLWRQVDDKREKDGVDDGNSSEEAQLRQIKRFVHSMNPNDNAGQLLQDRLETMEVGLFCKLLRDLGTTCMTTHRVQQLFDWVRTRPEGTPGAHLCTTQTYNTLISLCGPWSDVKRAIEMVSEMRLRGLEVGLETYSALITTCVKCGELDLACDVNDSMIKDGFVDISCANMMIDVFQRLGDSKRLLGVLDAFDKQNETLDLYTYNAIVTACSKCGLASAALQVYRHLCSRGLMPNHKTLYSMICSVNKKEAEEQLEYIELLLKYTPEAQVEPIKMWYVAMTMCEKNMGYANLALAIFKRIHSLGGKPDLTLCNSAIAACAHDGQHEQADRMFEEMAKYNVKPDAVSYANLIRAYKKGGRWCHALLVFEKMKVAGFTPHAAVYASVIDLLFHTGNHWAQVHGAQVLQEGLVRGILDQPMEHVKAGTLKLDLQALTVGEALLNMRLWLLNMRERVQNNRCQNLNSSHKLSVVNGAGKHTRGQSNSTMVKEWVGAMLTAHPKSPFRKIPEQPKSIKLEASMSMLKKWLFCREFEVYVNMNFPLDCSMLGKQISVEEFVKEELDLEKRCDEAMQEMCSAQEKCYPLDWECLCHRFPSYQMFRRGLVQQILHKAMELQLNARVGHGAVMLLDHLAASTTNGQQLIMSLARNYQNMLCLALLMLCGSGLKMDMSALQPGPPVAQQVLKEIEGAVRHVLGDMLTCTSPVDCVQLYFIRLGMTELNDPIYTSTVQLLQDLVMDGRCLNYLPTVLGAAAVTVSRRRKGLLPCWPTVLALLTKYTESSRPDFKNAIKLVESVRPLLHISPDSPLSYRG